MKKLTYTEMVPLMGEIVTVTHELKRTHNSEELQWKLRKLSKHWSGWIVGFRYRMNGLIEYNGEEEGSAFHETSRQPCVLVASWPTKLPVSVPLDGYYLGGEPKPPDNGGWCAYKQRQEKKND